LKHDKTNEAQILLIEEPENHLSHTKLNELLNDIVKNVPDKQVIISTHSSFVSNKLGINNLILLNANTSIKLLDLDQKTYDFFKKLPGYNTLRFILCKKVILVEGPSDELILQKAYLKRRDNLPIEEGIDVISCGLSFKRFLDIALKLNIKVAVLTDNDGNYEENIGKKYKEYMDTPNILICASDNNDLNTLEPQFVEVNDIELLKSIFNLRRSVDKNSIISYLIKHKTDWALKIFELDGRNSYKINYPDYFEEAISWCLN
jgi:putative ATP-dependent endonuclease of OLD family